MKINTMELLKDPHLDLVELVKAAEKAASSGTVKDRNAFLELCHPKKFISMIRSILQTMPKPDYGIKLKDPSLASNEKKLMLLMADVLYLLTNTHGDRLVGEVDRKEIFRLSELVAEGRGLEVTPGPNQQEQKMVVSMQPASATEITSPEPPKKTGVVVKQLPKNKAISKNSSSSRSTCVIPAEDVVLRQTNVRFICSKLKVSRSELADKIGISVTIFREYFYGRDLHSDFVAQINSALKKLNGPNEEFLAAERTFENFYSFSENMPDVQERVNQVIRALVKYRCSKQQLLTKLGVPRSTFDKFLAGGRMAEDVRRKIFDGLWGKDSMTAPETARPKYQPLSSKDILDRKSKVDEFCNDRNITLNHFAVLAGVGDASLVKYRKGAYLLQKTIDKIETVLRDKQ